MRTSDFLDELYNTQKSLQEDMLGQIQSDHAMMYKMATAAIVEICEMLQADTRWKPLITGSKKTPRWDDEQFKEEFADAIIYLMNVLIFQGVSIDEAKKAIFKKLEINKRRFYENRHIQDRD